MNITTENRNSEKFSALETVATASIGEPADRPNNADHKKSAARKRRPSKESNSISSAERRSAAAGPRRARIVEFETGAVQPLDEVERGPRDIRERHFVNQN